MPHPQTPERQALLDEITKARADQSVLKARLRAQYEKDMEDSKLHLSRLANRALAEGCSVAAIGRAYGTTNFPTIRKLLDLTAAEAAAHQAITTTVQAAVEDEHAWADEHPWEHDPATNTVTLHKWYGLDWEEHYDERVLEVGPDQNGFPVLIGDPTGIHRQEITRIQTVLFERAATRPTPRQAEPTGPAEFDWEAYLASDHDNEED